MKHVWVRTCQECGHKQVMKSPKDQKTDNWRDAECRKCHSPSLDYGSEMKQRNDGSFIHITEEK